MTEETDAPQGGAEAIVTHETLAPAVETPSETTTEQPAATETAEIADDAGEAPEKPKRVPWFQKRIDEVTRQKYEAQREADYWRGRAEAPGQTATQPAAVEAPPTLEQFDYDETRYQQASAQYYEKAAERAAERVLESRTAKEREQAQIEAATARLAEGGAKHQDFAEVVHDIPLTEAVQQLLVNEERAADVLYQVGKDPEQARRIFSLSPYLQAVELGKVAARLETPSAKSPKPIPPAPPTTVGAVSAGLSKTPEEMSMAEYIAWRSKQEA
jgi:hypothetical protein